MFSYADKQLGLKPNPTKKVKKTGSMKSDEIQIWTKEEYTSFLEAVSDKNLSFYAFDILYWTGIREGERLFLFTKSHLWREMRKGCAKSGVKCIRVHDLRYSHVSMLIDMGFSAVAIAARVGHESQDITYRYAHLFPNVQDDMADSMQDIVDRKRQK